MRLHCWHALAVGYFLCFLFSFNIVCLNPLQGAASTANSPRCISDADIEAAYSQAEKIARSITSASNSGMSLSSLDDTTKQEVLEFFNLIETPFAELASSQSSQLVSCLTKIQTISAAFFTQAQQEQVNQMASQVQAKVAQVRQFQDEIKAKNDYIASVKGISSSILANNEKEAKLKQEEQLLAKEELELRTNLEWLIKKKLGVREERERLYAETKDLLIKGTQIETAAEDLRKAKLKLRALSHEWDLFSEHFANLKP